MMRKRMRRRKRGKENESLLVRPTVNEPHVPVLNLLPVAVIDKEDVVGRLHPMQLLHVGSIPRLVQREPGEAELACL